MGLAHVTKGEGMKGSHFSGLSLPTPL